jgi:hypothetical protein
MNVITYKFMNGIIYKFMNLKYRKRSLREINSHTAQRSHSLISSGKDTEHKEAWQLFSSGYHGIKQSNHFSK